MPDLFDDILPVEPERLMGRTLVTVSADDFVTLTQLSVLLKLGSQSAVVAELIRRAAPSPNGSAYEVQCFGCGKKFTVDRRPIPGRRQWCDTCRASGEPAAQRARDYRERKRSQ